VIQIQGTLTNEGTAPFYEAGPAVVGQAFGSPGYIGGIGFTETYAETISFSCWSSYRAARDYAFSSGHHNEARKRDRAEQWHDPETDCFMRLRPLASTGSLLGRNPFEALATVPS
jgi:hypothetical protein